VTLNPGWRRHRATDLFYDLVLHFTCFSCWNRNAINL